MNIKSNIGDFYDSFHNSSNVQYKLIQKNNFTYQNILKVLDEYIDSGKDILDVGCGVGTLSLYLASKAKFVTGIDISPVAVDIANKSSKLNFLDKKAYFYCDNFPFNLKNNKFDVVLCSEVLEHILDEKLALSKIYQTLNKDGLLILTVPSKNSLIYKLGLAKKFDKEVGHIRRYTNNSLRLKLSNMGFRNIKIYKTEGLIRNILFTLKYANFLTKFMRGYFGVFINYIDSLTIPIVGESQLIVICNKF